MLVRVIIGNLYSFREKTEFNMLTGKVRTHPHHVHNLGKVQVVRAAAIYGANGAGKSNLVKALDLLHDAAISARIPNEKISPFKLGGVPADLPYSHIEVEINIGKKNYLYGLELTHNRVVEEWLYESGLGEKPDTLIFERKTDAKGDTVITFAPKYEGNVKERLRKELYESEILKPYTTLLWQLGQAKRSEIKESKLVLDWLEGKLTIVFPDSKPIHLMREFVINEDFKKFATDMMPTLDTGIVSFDIKSEPITPKEEGVEAYETMLRKFKDISDDEFMMVGREDGGMPALIVLEDNSLIKKILNTVHSNSSKEPVVFDFNIESDGTMKIIDHLLIIYETIKNGGTFIVDEIERSIHPSLIKTILQKLMAEKEVNGQLIFTTHESNLLDLSMLRSDEIWFSEKDEMGATRFYPLSDFQIRPDLDIEKGYLLGRFGAVPMLADIKNLNWQDLVHA